MGPGCEILFRVSELRGLCDKTDRHAISCSDNHVQLGNNCGCISEVAKIRHLQSCTARIENLIELLTDEASLEITAKITASICELDAMPETGEAQLSIRFSGPDTKVLLADDGRVLDAIEQLAADIVELSDSERHKLKVETDSVPTVQQLRMKRVAQAAASRMHRDGSPHVFPPMCLQDRLLLERELVSSGLCFETLGNERVRWIVLLPSDFSTYAEAATMKGCFH